MTTYSAVQVIWKGVPPDSVVDAMGEVTESEAHVSAGRAEKSRKLVIVALNISLF